MSDILLGWEYGSGHGHVNTLLPIARSLAAAGHRPMFAVRDIVESWPVLKDQGFPVFPAPFWPSRLARHGGSFRARSFADILSYFGWCEPGELEGMVRAWDALIDLVRPALIVLDHAPTLSLAARGRIPVVAVGTGFSNPPAQLTQYPVLDRDGRAIHTEGELLASIAEVQRRLGRPPPGSLAGTLGHGKCFVTTFPEVDPYRPHRIEKPIGPLAKPPLPSPLPAVSRWFGYMSAERPEVESILLDLAATGIPGEAYVRGAAPPLRAVLRAAGIQVHDRPAPIGEVLSRVGVVVHAGGGGLTSNALAAGRPQLLMPEHLEQRLTAGLLAGLGVGLSVPDKEAPGKSLLRLLKGELYKVEAQERAAEIRAKGPWEGLARVAEACLGELGG